METHPLIALLEQMKHQVSDDAKGLETVSKIEFTVASYSPQVNYQVNVKFRDASLAWATCVGTDPAYVFQEALYIALRGEEARKTESKAIFHPTRDLAKVAADLIEFEHEDRVLMTKLELEPYKGWVVVVVPKPGADLTDLLPMIEIRKADAVRQEKPAPRGSFSKARTEAIVGSIQTLVGAIQAAPEGGRASLTKDKLEAEYKSIFGKGPDRNIKKLDLAKMLDDLEAQSKSTPAVEVPAEEEDDLL